MRPMAFLSRRPPVPRIAAILLAASLCVSAGAWPVDAPWSRATLKEIKAVEVVVEDIGPDAERDGLTKFQLQRDVESRLTQAGIPLASRAPEYLYVVVNTVKDSGGLYAFSIRVELKQPVTLIRNPTISTIAGTWSVGGGGFIGAARLPEVRSRVADFVDTFINAYLEQNPK